MFKMSALFLFQVSEAVGYTGAPLLSLLRISLACCFLDLRTQDAYTWSDVWCY